MVLNFKASTRTFIYQTIEAPSEHISFLYFIKCIRKIAAAIYHLLDHAIKTADEGVSHSVAEIINLIQQIKGTNWVVQSEGERRPEEVMYTQADIRKASEVLGWSPKWSPRSGCRRY